MSSPKKYRGKPIAGGEMVIGGYCEILEHLNFKAYIILDGSQLIDKSPGGARITGLVEVIPETVRQYTGLKDWYAGDIIQKGEIIRAISVNWEHGMRFMLGKHILCKQDAINGTKIGTIHDNPELLE